MDAHSVLDSSSRASIVANVFSSHLCINTNYAYPLREIEREMFDIFQQTLEETVFDMRKKHKLFRENKHEKTD